MIDVALALRKLLEMLELPSVPKTSGQKGLHVLVPDRAGSHAPRRAHELAYRMSMLVARLYPNEVSLEAQTETRRGRLYLDHLQNFMGKSLVLPYSLRAADGAPASTPLEWSEVTRKLDPKRVHAPHAARAPRREGRSRRADRGRLARSSRQAIARLK